MPASFARRWCQSCFSRYRGLCAPDSRFAGLRDIYTPLCDQPFQGTIDIASSNFSEATAIFGGADNLRIALDNLTRQYKPSAIGIASTCLSETIGDDVRSYIEQYKAANRGVEIPALIHASTPSYRGNPYGRLS